MRQIKFRGKRKDTGEWVYGALALETMIGQEGSTPSATSNKSTSGL